jgi:hypothetical protein
MKRAPFIEEMRAAIAADRKFKTRRIRVPGRRCPYRVGDLLGVGEPHLLYVLQHQSSDPALGCRYGDGSTRLIPIGDDSARDYLSKATVGLTPDCIFFRRPARLRSGRFLPDVFVRLRIRVTGIAEGRLQEITPEDAWAEGLRCSCMHPETCVGSTELVPAFAALWDRLHRAPGERWADDPPVWIVSFARVR